MSSPSELGRYQIKELLGKGAHAEVYRAEDTVLQRIVAIKILRPSLLADDEYFARFQQEARMAAQLFHPQIATVLDMGEAQGRYYLAMRYVEGLSLTDHIKSKGSLSWKETQTYFEQLVSALHFAHEKGLVHRDVKPQNILISESEGAVLTDFGLVKAMQTSGMTRSTTLIGTPAYIAPEIWDDQPASPASDQYALACVLVEMLSGKTLFGGKSTPGVMKKHLLDPPALPEKYPEGSPENLGEILDQALDKDPHKRFADLSELLEALQAQESVEVDLARVEAVGAEAGSRADELAKQLNVRGQQLVDGIKNSSRTIKNSDPDEMQIELAPEIFMIFVRVPAGSFLMGSLPNDKLASDDEKPQHELYLDEFWMGKSPVTNQQYRAFVKASGHKPPRGWNNIQYPGGESEHPVVTINWDDARRFCEWASQVSGERIHLPSEAEWEKAARGGLSGKKYPWGDENPVCSQGADNGAQFSACSGRTISVGSFCANDYGLYDMSGNVWEWVSDWYDTDCYANSPSNNPSGPSAGEYRVLRGGSWYCYDFYLRSANRVRYNPDYAGYDFGFRCSRSLP